MPKARTTQQNKEWWLTRADEYSREANKCKTPEAIRHWFDRAAAALAKAESYSS